MSTETNDRRQVSRSAEGRRERPENRSVNSRRENQERGTRERSAHERNTHGRHTQARTNDTKRSDVRVSDIEHMLAGVDADEAEYIKRRAQRREARIRAQKKKKRALLLLVALVLFAIMVIGMIIGGVITLFQEDPFEEGNILLQEYDYLGAIEWYELAIEEENNVATAYRAIGLAYWELEMYEESQEAILTSFDQGAEETSIAYNMLLTLEMEEENYTEALAYIATMLELDDLTDAMKQQILKYEIICYESMYDWDIVTEKLQAYVSLYPTDTEMAKELEFFETR